MINVQFADATQAAVISIFGSPPDATLWANTGTVEDTDPRYLAFLNPASTVAGASAAQATTLYASYEVAVAAGFSSSALGAAYIYPSGQDDQANMTASAAAAMAAMLVAAAWKENTAYTAASIVSSNGQLYQCASAGTSGATAPTFPTTKSTSVTDGSATWQIWMIPFECTDASGVTSWQEHSATEIIQAGNDVRAGITAVKRKYATLAAQLATAAAASATTVGEIQAIVWY